MIEFVNVSKQFGSVSALDHLNLSISEDGIYGLLGKNGAGKTTLMKLLAGYIPVTEGQITVDNQIVSPAQMPDSVSFIESGSPQFNMRVSGLIEAAANIQAGFDQDFALDMAKQFGLELDKKYKSLSYGKKTMLTTILNLAGGTKIVLLDEPVSGFDAIIRDQFNTLLQESYQNNPRIIIVSTHLIDEIAKVTERLMIINDGKILLHTDIEDIDEHAYTLTGTKQAVLPLLDGLNCIAKTTVGNMVAAHIYDNRIMLPDDVELSKLTLQDFFIKFVGGSRNYG